jgi:hypothetical protein
MASLFSNSEYIDIVMVHGEASGVLLESREFPCYFLWGCMNDLVYSIPIDTIEVLRKRVENATTTIHNTEECWKEWKNHFVGTFIIVLTITAVTLNTFCNA